MREMNINFHKAYKTLNKSYKKLCKNCKSARYQNQTHKTAL